MNSKLNEILLNRKDMISINYEKDDSSELDKWLIAATASKNLEGLGYKFSSRLIEQLKKTSVEEILEIENQISANIENRQGDDVDYKPMYPGFPDSVMDKSKAELYLDAIIYAESGFKTLPLEYEFYGKEKKEEVINLSKKLQNLKTIDVGTQKDVIEIAVNLMSSPIAYSPDDKCDLAIISKEVKSFKKNIPGKIPNKENLAWMAASLARQDRKNSFIVHLTSATDILRALTVRNGGDASLTQPVKFGKIPAYEVKQYAIQLAKVKNIEKDISQRPETFKRVFKQYHLPNMYKTQLKSELSMESRDKMIAVSNHLYEDKLEPTFEARRNQLIKENDFKSLINLYYAVPGKLAADMDYILILADKIAKDHSDYIAGKEKNYAEVCKVFNSVVNRIAPNTLLRMQSAIGERTAEKQYRVYAANKGLSNPYMKEDTRNPLPKKIVESINNIIDNDLSMRYSKKRPLGKVYLDDDLKNVKIPSAQRTNSKGAQTLSYGSQIDIRKNTEKLRSFIWWTNAGHDSIDIDLSATFYDENWRKFTDVSYYNLKGNGYGVHSGDIRDGGSPNGKGAAEFIDVDLSNLKAKNVGYVVFSVNNFSEHTFSNTPCKFGWMELEEKENFLFDPLAVQKTVNLNCPSTKAITMTLDVENEKIIWMDRNPRNVKTFVINHKANNVETHASSMMVEAYKAINLPAPSLHHLMSLHIMSRGELVEDPKEADVIFSLNRINEPKEFPNMKENICAYDNDVILGDLLSTELSMKDTEYFEKLAKQMETDKVKENLEPSKDGITK